nr:MAG TPA: hypothetical protein [Caudoviricetes sp.]
MKSSAYDRDSAVLVIPIQGRLFFWFCFACASETSLILSFYVSFEAKKIFIARSLDSSRTSILLHING